jgi:cytoskeletal protein CcmA (bactofilin family)
MFKRKPSKQPQIDTLISAKTRINGDVEFSGGLHLDGYINGNVRGDLSTDATLSVSEAGGIEGSVSVSHIVLNGLVKGDIEATGRVDLGEKARVWGNVYYAAIETAVGAQINGKLLHGTTTDRNAVSGDSDVGPGDEPQL